MNISKTTTNNCDNYVFQGSFKKRAFRTAFAVNKYGDQSARERAEAIKKHFTKSIKVNDNLKTVIYLFNLESKRLHDKNLVRI
jgi:hypothetical protein